MKHVLSALVLGTALATPAQQPAPVPYKFAVLSYAGLPPQKPCAWTAAVPSDGAHLFSITDGATTKTMTGTVSQDSRHGRVMIYIPYLPQTMICPAAVVADAK